MLSVESGLIGIQACLLLSRTWLTDYISRIEARAGRYLIAQVRHQLYTVLTDHLADFCQYGLLITSLVLQNFSQFARLLAAFAGVAIPAAVVNSGLKYMQKRIQIAFQRRLTHHLHQQYCSNRAYYAASTLGGLTNADQRITEDVEKFSYNISELYSYTFKVKLCPQGVVMLRRKALAVIAATLQFLTTQCVACSAPPLEACSTHIATTCCIHCGMRSCSPAAAWQDELGTLS